MKAHLIQALDIVLKSSSLMLGYLSNISIL